MLEKTENFLMDLALFNNLGIFIGKIRIEVYALKTN